MLSNLPKQTVVVIPPHSTCHIDSFIDKGRSATVQNGVVASVREAGPVSKSGPNYMGDGSLGAGCILMRRRDIPDPAGSDTTKDDVAAI